MQPGTAIYANTMRRFLLRVMYVNLGILQIHKEFTTRQSAGIQCQANVNTKFSFGAETRQMGKTTEVN